MRCGLWCLDFQQAIISDKPVGARVRVRYGGMADEADLGHFATMAQFVLGARVRFLLGAPLHGGRGEALDRIAGQALDDQIGHHIGAGGSPSGFGLGEGFGDARSSERAATRMLPLRGALDQLLGHSGAFMVSSLALAFSNCASVISAKLST